MADRALRFLRAPVALGERWAQPVLCALQEVAVTDAERIARLRLLLRKAIAMQTAIQLIARQFQPLIDEIEKELKQ